MTLRALSLLAFAALLAACGDGSPPASDAFTNGGGSGGSGGSPSSGCADYCAFVVAHGTGCENFDVGGRCVANCSKYAAGACAAEWQAFRLCVKNSSSLSCKDNDGGTPILVTAGCNAENTAWAKCLEEKDAGICY